MIDFGLELYNDIYIFDFLETYIAYAEFFSAFDKNIYRVKMLCIK